MMVYAITDTKKGEQGLRLLIFKLPSSLSNKTVLKYQRITKIHYGDEGYKLEGGSK